jgi:hypothetical protein
MRIRTSACREKREESLLKSEERERPIVDWGTGRRRERVAANHARAKTMSSAAIATAPGTARSVHY